MEDASSNARKNGDDSNEVPFKDDREENDSGFSNSNTVTKRINPLHTLHFNVMQRRARKGCIRNSVFPIGFGLLDDRIPKRLVTIDEKHSQQCLELINLSASKPARDNISVKSSLAKTNILYDYLNLGKSRIRENCDMDRLIAVSPLTSVSSRDVMNPIGKWIVGSIMGSNGFMNIMKSPLFNQFGLENISSSCKIDSNDSKKSPHRTSQFSSQNQEIGGSSWENRKYESESANEEHASTSGTFCSSFPWSSTSGTFYRGMLHCKWKDGVPYFVFSLDDHKEIYEANMWKVNLVDDKDSDYVYLFSTGKNGGKINESYREEESRHVGKMTVSTTFSLCSNNLKIMETEFVLYGGIDESEVEISNSGGDNIRKKKLIRRKVVEVFRSNPISKPRGVSSFSGTISGMETPKNLEPVERFHLLDNNLPTNFQLAASVVKDHVRENHANDNDGGWGLKFLKKIETKPITETSMASECISRNDGECSSSMDILVPAGIHSGPRTRIGGPSSITERWRSGGVCDCGGWDVGCPLSMFKVRQDELLPDMHGECKSVNIHVQGSEHGQPALRMVNIRDDLYFIHFRPNLSSLQAFSIAVAIIHSRSPTLKPKNWSR